jgi:hypothetical protein
MIENLHVKLLWVYFQNSKNHMYSNICSVNKVNFDLGFEHLEEIKNVFVIRRWVIELKQNDKYVIDDR